MSAVGILGRNGSGVGDQSSKNQQSFKVAGFDSPGRYANHSVAGVTSSGNRNGIFNDFPQASNLANESKDSRKSSGPSLN